MQPGPNLELILALSQHSFPITEQSLPRLRKFDRVERLEEDHQLYLLELLDGHHHRAQPNMIHAWIRLGRLPRLADGIYEVALGPRKITIEDADFKLPESKVVITHKRTHHPAARFNPDTLFSDKPIKIEDDKSRPGFVALCENVASYARHFATTLSEFSLDFAQPEQWRDTMDRYDDWHSKVWLPFVDSQQAILAADGHEIQRETIAKVKKSYDRFLAEHKEINDGVRRVLTELYYTYSDGLRKLLTTYQSSVTGRPFVAYTEASTFACDDLGRILWEDITAFPPLRNRDIRNATLEKKPFNDKFHAEFREKLLRIEPELKPYARHALGLLHDAMFQLFDDAYAGAITRASTAFESALNGFLVDAQVISEDDAKFGTHTLRDRMRRLFDQAVLKDPQYKGRREYVFPEHLREKILGMNPSKTVGSLAAHQIRGIEAHQGMVYRDPRHAEHVATVTVQVYLEAVQYLVYAGWKNGKSPSMADIEICMFPDMGKSVPYGHPGRALQLAKDGLARVLGYLDPAELAYYKRTVPKNNWAREIVEKA